MNVSDEMYRRIVEAVPEGIWVVDPQGRTIFSNRRMAEILGTDFELDGRAVLLCCVFPDELADAQRHFARTLAGDRRPFDFRLRRADGSPIWVSISCMPVCDDTGAQVGLLGLFSDISERKQAEAALRESEERFRATFSQAAVGIAQTSPDGKWLLLNDRFCEILGYTQAELRGKTFLDITHPDDREASLTAVRRLLAGEISSWSAEKRYIHKDGAIVWARLCVSLVRDQDNRPQYFISVVEDVTERIQAERALRDSEQRLVLAQSAAHLGLWERDLRTNVKTISGEYATLYGLAPDHPALTYEEWLSLIHPRRPRAGASAHTGEYRTDARLGHRIPRRVAGRKRSLATRKGYGVPRRLRPASPHQRRQSRYHRTKRAEETLRRNLDEIAHLNRVAAMGELAASLAHELNQPLAAILTNAQAASRFLGGKSPDLARVRECLTAIAADDERAGEVIKRLRALLKKGESQASLVDLNEVVSDAIRLVGNDAMLRKHGSESNRSPVSRRCLETGFNFTRWC